MLIAEINKNKDINLIDVENKYQSMIIDLEKIIKDYNKLNQKPLCPSNIKHLELDIYWAAIF